MPFAGSAPSITALVGGADQLRHRDDGRHLTRWCGRARCGRWASRWLGWQQRWRRASQPFAKPARGAGRASMPGAWVGLMGPGAPAAPRSSSGSARKWSAGDGAARDPQPASKASSVEPHPASRGPPFTTYLAEQRATVRGDHPARRTSAWIRAGCRRAFRRGQSSLRLKRSRGQGSARMGDDVYGCFGLWRGALPFSKRRAAKGLRASGHLELAPGKVSVLPARQPHAAQHQLSVSKGPWAFGG